MVSTKAILIFGILVSFSIQMTVSYNSWTIDHSLEKGGQCVEIKNEVTGAVEAISCPGSPEWINLIFLVPLGIVLVFIGWKSISPFTS